MICQACTGRATSPSAAQRCALPLPGCTCKSATSTPSSWTAQNSLASCTQGLWTTSRACWVLMRARWLQRPHVEAQARRAAAEQSRLDYQAAAWRGAQSRLKLLASLCRLCFAFTMQRCTPMSACRRLADSRSMRPCALYLFALIAPALCSCSSLRGIWATFAAPCACLYSRPSTAPACATCATGSSRKRCPARGSLRGACPLTSLGPSWPLSWCAKSCTGRTRTRALQAAASVHECEGNERRARCSDCGARHPGLR